MSQFEQIHVRTCDGHHDGGACAPDQGWPAAAERAIRPGRLPEDKRTPATAALIAGLVSLVFWPAGIVAIIMGADARRHRGHPRPLGHGRATVALALGIVTTAIMMAALIAHAIHPLATI